MKINQKKTSYKTKKQFVSEGSNKIEVISKLAEGLQNFNTRADISADI